MPTARAIHERFFEKVSMPDPDTGCMEWQAGTNGVGYGSIGMGRRRTELSHRWAYAYFVAPIPKGLTIDHLCMNRLCVAPDHLEMVSRAENAARGNRNRWGWRTGTCLRGHALSAATQVRGKCIDCINQRRREAYNKESK